METNNLKTWLILGFGGFLLGGLLFYSSLGHHGEDKTVLKETSLTTQHSLASKKENSQDSDATDLNRNSELTPSSKTSQTAQSLTATKSVSALSADDHKKWEVLQEILASQNDNDPRLDKTFKGMSDDLHLILQEQYLEIPAENRNQRGLLAFLIARDLKNTEDLDFLKKIYEESPCLSLENCNSRTSSDPHLSGVDEASMNYPQLASLYQLEKQLNDNPGIFADSSMKDHAMAVIEQALKFPVASVQRKAAEIQARF
ncbi:MAG: hypothetical protein IPK04_12860 [Bdellovibrionales bacterium]|nr:hypothetical protein [Bdellovibrionales bacterium]